MSRADLFEKKMRARGVEPRFGEEAYKQPVKWLDEVSEGRPSSQRKFIQPEKWDRLKEEDVKTDSNGNPVEDDDK